MWRLLPSLTTHRWLMHLVLVFALVLAPVMVSHAVPVSDAQGIVQIDLSEHPATPVTPQTGIATPLCHNGALCAFVGSSIQRNVNLLPVSGGKMVPPGTSVWRSWIGAPGSRPPKQI